MAYNKEDIQYVEKLINIRRVTKVVKGGKNMHFSALVVVGDKKGRVAFSTAKAREVADAVKKAVSRAKKDLVRIPLKFGRTLHHDFIYKKCSARVCIRSAKAGTGIIAGGSMRSLFEVLGIHDVVAKNLGSASSHNVVRALLSSLQMMESARDVAKKRNLSIAEVNHRRKVLSQRKWFDEKSSEEKEVADA